MNIMPYVKIARPDNWFKNVFMVPGWIFGFLLTQQESKLIDSIPLFLLGLVACCLTASANYSINEWLDREFDRFHPVKKNRPAVSSSVNSFGVYSLYVLLLIGGLSLAKLVNAPFFWACTSLAFMGIVYNVKPLRSKDKPILDVLSESINNPIRLLMGWYIATSIALPPTSLLISYWMGGAFLMTVKRYSEYRAIGDKTLAGNYRGSFKYYDDDKLLLLSFFYSICSAFFCAVFLFKYKIELILVFPLYSILFAWYLRIGLKPNSAAQHPERMYKEHSFIAFTLSVIAITSYVLTINIPLLVKLIDQPFSKIVNGIGHGN